MPTYEYVCLQCGRHTEAYQSFSDEPLSACPHCGGQLRKVFHPAGILFRGSGFYKTDSRSGAKSSSASRDGVGDSSGSGKTSESKGASDSKRGGGSGSTGGSGGTKQPAPAGGSKGQQG